MDVPRCSLFACFSEWKNPLGVKDPFVCPLCGFDLSTLRGSLKNALLHSDYVYEDKPYRILRGYLREMKEQGWTTFTIREIIAYRERATGKKVVSARRWIGITASLLKKICNVERTNGRDRHVYSMPVTV
jgi:hypothetical protein